MAGALAQILLRAKLAKQGAPQSSPVAAAPSSQPRINVGSILAGHKIMPMPTDSPSVEMLNANRPAIDEVPPAPTLSAPAASVPALQSASQTLSVAQVDWKKYLPWILIVVALVVVLAMSKKRSA